MGLRRMLVRMLDSEGYADGTRIIGITGGRAAWVDPSGGGGTPQLFAMTTIVGGVPDLIFDTDGRLVYTTEA